MPDIMTNSDRFNKFRVKAKKIGNCAAYRSNVIYMLYACANVIICCGKENLSFMFKNLSINNFSISLPESDEGSSQMRESQMS